MDGLTLPPCHACHVLVHFYKGCWAVVGALIWCFSGCRRVGSVVGLMALDGGPASDMILLLGRENTKRSLQRRWHSGQEQVTAKKPEGRRGCVLGETREVPLLKCAE